MSNYYNLDCSDNQKFDEAELDYLREQSKILADWVAHNLSNAEGEPVDKIIEFFKQNNLRSFEVHNMREKCLQTALSHVNKDRTNSYGRPERSFGDIAEFWSTYLGEEISPADVTAMMILLKVARIKSSPAHEDNWVDTAGYAACGFELAVPDEDDIPF